MVWGRYQIETGTVVKKLLPVLVLFLAASVAFAQDKRYTVPIEGSPVLGPANAPVTIIEFLDFQ
ncbi:MAG: hypothetical protein ABSA46_09030 [Thermodesulfovibrionales bacterium]